MKTKLWVPTCLLAALGAGPLVAGEAPTAEEATRALIRAVRYFHTDVARHGGYVWRSSGDQSLREGEGRATPAMIWVQPPGTPTVGEAFLDAHEATGDRACLDAAVDAAMALVKGQLHSGGWTYSIDFDPARRSAHSYRFDLQLRPLPDPVSPADRAAANGWDVWSRRRYKGNVTTLDDDTTQSALRLLMRVDRALDYRNETIHRATEYGLNALLRMQFANGAWSANFDRLQDQPPSAEEYPIKKAGYPPTWSRTWPKDFTGCYVTNDDLMADMVDTLLLAWEVYGDRKYWAGAQKAGDFLLLAQMPDPQPAWAQQYDRAMHPTWSRKFEPPAITGLESQTIMEALIRLARATGERKYVEPIPRAVAYLRKSQLPDGRLARFYELQTNRPLYFTSDYRLTYEKDDVPTHYGFVVGSRLDRIEKEHRSLLETVPARPKAGPPSASFAAEVRKLIDSQNERGAWVEKGRLKGYAKIDPPGGLIDCSTFAKNVRTLSRYLHALKGS